MCCGGHKEFCVLWFREFCVVDGAWVSVSDDDAASMCSADEQGNVNGGGGDDEDKDGEDQRILCAVEGTKNFVCCGS